MPLMETKVIQTYNNEAVINRTNEVYAYFGWSVMNVQITHSKSTHFENSLFDDSVTQVQTTVDYATITYQRDKKMPNYAELQRLESEYDQNSAVLSDLRGEGKKGSMNLIKLALYVIVWPVGLIKLILWAQQRARVASPENQARIQQYVDRQGEILETCESLL